MMTSELLEAGRSALVVIDIQGKLAEMVVHRDRVIAATNRLMQLAEMFGRPVVLTEQYPEGLGPTHPEVRAVYDTLTVPKRHVPKVERYDLVIPKRFADTELLAPLFDLLIDGRFREAVSQLLGYDVSVMGTLILED